MSATIHKKTMNGRRTWLFMRIFLPEFCQLILGSPTYHSGIIAIERLLLHYADAFPENGEETKRKPRHQTEDVEQLPFDDDIEDDKDKREFQNADHRGSEHREPRRHALPQVYPLHG